MDIASATKAAIYNRDKIDDDTPCGCYYCLHTFKGNDIKEWVDKETTALCPSCSIDSVIPNMTDVEVLTAAFERWFTGIE